MPAPPEQVAKCHEVPDAAADGTLLHRALGDRSRVRILRALRAAGRGLDVVELAEAVGLHPNTVRSHVALLEDAHLVTRSPAHDGGRGRPRTLYSSARRPDAGEDEAAAPLLELLDGLGFEPELAAGDAGPEVRMHACPFGIAPGAPAPRTCRAHLGLIRGALAELRAPLTVGRLEIFPDPAYCTVRLRTAGSAETT